MIIEIRRKKVVIERDEWQKRAHMAMRERDKLKDLVDKHRQALRQARHALERGLTDTPEGRARRAMRQAVWLIDHRVDGAPFPSERKAETP